MRRAWHAMEAWKRPRQIAAWIIAGGMCPGGGWLARECSFDMKSIREEVDEFPFHSQAHHQICKAGFRRFQFNENSEEGLDTGAPDS